MTDQETGSKPSRSWLIGLAVIPLLLAAVIGYSLMNRSQPHNGGEPAPGGTLPTLAEPARGNEPAEPPALAPLSIVRHGKEITLTGSLPDAASKRVLLDAVVTSIEDVNVFDHLDVAPDAKSLDFSAAGPVFEAAAAIPDFSVTVSGGTVTLGGTAAKADQADAVEDAAEDAWPEVNIVNQMEISSLVKPPAR